MISSSLMTTLRVGFGEIFSLTEWFPLLGREKKTEIQVETPMKSFKANPYPGIKEKHQLAKSLNISKRAGKKWFISMRSKELSQRMLKKIE